MWQKLIFSIGLTAFFFCAQAERKSYRNYHVYEVTASDESQLDTLSSLDGSSDEVILLNPNYSLNRPLHIVVAPNLVETFVSAVENKAIPYNVLSKNAEQSFNGQERVAQRALGEYTWTQYHLLEDNYAWLRQLATKYPKQASVFVAGKSYEGREILGLKISYGKCVNTAKNCGIFVHGGAHAREWISPATVTYIINQLLTSTDKRIRRIAESYTWYLVPHGNPDGYVYSHTTDRLWRKTRKPYGKCVGADPNRNFDVHWNTIGTSNDTCSEIYAGPKAFSEIEILSLSQYITKLKNELFFYLSFHSYGQELIFPYGYANKTTSNYNDLVRISKVAVAAIAKRYGTKYVSGTTYNVVGGAAGDSLDWNYEKAGVPYVMEYELRPQPDAQYNGFILPADQIIPTCLETMDAVVAMIEEMRGLKPI